MKDWKVAAALLVIVVLIVMMFTPVFGGVWNLVLGRQDISRAINDLIDSYNPDSDFLEESLQTCIEAGGTPRNDATAVGCFGMPFGTWNTQNCAIGEMGILQDECERIGARFVCETTDVGCLY